MAASMASAIEEIRDYCKRVAVCDCLSEAEHDQLIKDVAGEVAEVIFREGRELVRVTRPETH